MASNKFATPLCDPQWHAGVAKKARHKTSCRNSLQLFSLTYLATRPLTHPYTFWAPINILQNRVLQNTLGRERRKKNCFLQSGLSELASNQASQTFEPPCSLYHRLFKLHRAAESPAALVKLLTPTPDFLTQRARCALLTGSQGLLRLEAHWSHSTTPGTAPAARGQGLHGASA